MSTKKTPPSDSPDPFGDEQDRNRLRDLLLEGARSAPSGIADEAYFAALRDEVRKRLTARA